MKLNSENKGIFSNTYKRYALLNLIGSIQGRDISISICSTNNINYINVDLAIHLIILQLNIFEQCERYGINNLQLTINDYTFIA